MLPVALNMMLGALRTPMPAAGGAFGAFTNPVVLSFFWIPSSATRMDPGSFPQPPGPPAW